jgi:hypothetical protein
MSGIKDKEHIDELRRRLYDRGGEVEELARQKLTPRNIEVSRGWSGVSTEESALVEPVSESTFKPDVEPARQPQPELGTEPNLPADFAPVEATPITKTKKRYRVVILLASLGFFVLTAIVSSIYLFFGANQISAKNITLALNAPFAVSGGEVASLQVNVTNQNSVPIQSATLIINYPSGTRSAEEGNKELYEERIPIELVKPGQAINIPLRVILSGEENEDKEIRISIEYRVEGSNGSFYKEAEPKVVKISSSPVLIKIEGLAKVSSGQEVDLTLIVQSNSTSEQKNVLVTANYPNSFSFIKSDPTPTYAKNTWLIEKLPSGGSVKLKLKGRIEGLANETAEVEAKVGLPKIENQNSMQAVLSQASLIYTIEKPFTSVVVKVNGESRSPVVLEKGIDSRITVTIENTLDETIYDMRVEIKPRGNLIRDDRLRVDAGYYDANSKVISYDSSGDKTLSQVEPGGKRTFVMTVTPDDAQATASFNISAEVFARRVNEPSAIETLIGSALMEVKYSSVPEFGLQLGFDDGPFKDTGPIPPVAGQKTTYTVTWVASAGVNDLTDTNVTANLPQYLTFNNEVSGDGKIEFNPVAKQLKWNIGDIGAGDRKVVKFQVTLLPSVTQVGRTVVLFGRSNIRATDRFTNTAVSNNGKELNTELSTELGFAKDNGVIQASANGDN